MRFRLRSRLTNSFIGTGAPPPSYDPDYQAILDYATLQGYALPSSAQQDLQNQLVVDLKSAGVWSKLDAFSVFATDGDVNFALIDWKRLVTQTAVNSPTFTINRGFDGNGVSAYIDTLFLPSINAVNLNLNNAGFGYHTFDSILEAGYKYGTFNSFNNRMFLYFESLGLVRVNSNSTYSAGVVAGTDIFISCNRVNSTTVNRYINGVLNGSGASTSDPNGLPNVSNIQVLSAGGFNGYSNQNVSMCYTASNLSAEASGFNTAYRNYLSAI